MNGPIGSKSPGIFKASCRTDWSITGKLDARDRNNVEFSRMAMRCISGREYRETCRDRRRPGTPEFPEDSVSTGKPVTPGYSGYPETPGDSRNSETECNDEDRPHNHHIPSNYVLHMEKVFSIVRQIYGRSPTGQMKDLDVHTAICCIFMSVTLQAAVHLGID